MKILFKYASRGRPEWFKATLDKWYSMLSGLHEYQFVVSIDKDDEIMNNKKIKDYCNSKPKLELCIGFSKSKVEAINADMTGREFDILVLVSDDMVPVVPGYDLVIVSEMLRYFPNLDGALKFNDDFRNDALITLSIMGKKMYDHFGYIYHPAYNSQWCDNEFTDVVNDMKKVVWVGLCIVKHEWMKYGNDDLYKKNQVSFFKDKKIYLDRKKRSFPKGVLSEVA